MFAALRTLRAGSGFVAQFPPCQAWLFLANREQAVRIPMEAELPGREGIINPGGDRPVVEPVHKKDLAALLDSWEPLDEHFPEINDPPAAAKNIL